MPVCIIVPAYNGAAYLESTLRGVLAQTMRDWELLIVDDGSRDGTVEAAEACSRGDPRVRIVQQEHAGVAHARNRGLVEAAPEAEFVTFLDQDDLWEPDALETLSSVLVSHPGAAAAYGLSRLVDERAQPIRPGELEVWGRLRRGISGRRVVMWPPNAPTTFAVLAYRCCIATPGQVLVRRSALEAVGPFDPATTPCDDWDLWLRLSLRGVLIYVERVVLSKRFHGNNTSVDGERIAEGVARVLRKLLSSGELTETQREIALVANWYWGVDRCTTHLHAARFFLASGRLLDGARQVRRALAAYLRCARGIPVQ